MGGGLGKTGGILFLHSFKRQGFTNGAQFESYAENLVCVRLIRCSVSALFLGLEIFSLPKDGLNNFELRKLFVGTNDHEFRFKFVLFCWIGIGNVGFAFIWLKDNFCVLFLLMARNREIVVVTSIA